MKQGEISWQTWSPTG